MGRPHPPLRSGRGQGSEGASKPGPGSHTLPRTEPAETLTISEIRSSGESPAWRILLVTSSLTTSRTFSSFADGKRSVSRSRAWRAVVTTSGSGTSLRSISASIKKLQRIGQHCEHYVPSVTHPYTPHGYTAARLAKREVYTLATRESHPSAVLSGLNEAMLRQRREHGNYKFCTVAYAKLETNGGDTKHGAKVTVCRGGHSPPFLLKADGSIYKIGQPGHAIGVFDDANLTDQEARLAPGDALVLYTDGVVEARSPDGLFFGEERLMALLRSSAALEASRIASRIEEAVLNFQEHAPRDDIAVLVLRVPN